jgi:hypothetical protein
MRILIYNTIAAETFRLLTKELINSTFQFQTCELHVHFLKDVTVIVEICGLSLEDLTGNTVQDHTCG